MISSYSKWEISNLEARNIRHVNRKLYIVQEFKLIPEIVQPNIIYSYIMCYIPPLSYISDILT